MNVNNLISLEDRTEQERSVIASKGAYATNKLKRLEKLKRLAQSFLNIETKAESYEQELASKYSVEDIDELYNIKLTIKETNKLNSLNNRSTRAYDLFMAIADEVKEKYGIDYKDYLEEEGRKQRETLAYICKAFKIKL